MKSEMSLTPLVDPLWWLGIDIEGIDGDDTLTGTNAPDRINGMKGNDLVDKRESRRWRHGEQSLRAANNTTWRKAA